jgi:Bacterial Ig domain
MKKYSLIAPLGNRERIGNQKFICMLSVLAVLPAWISATGFEQQLVLASFINPVYGQQESPSAQGSTPFLEWYQTQRAEQQISNPLAVKITSPAKGQQVPAGQSLIVSGESSDNSTSECKVSVIVNGERPYQPAFANGTGGTNDYSTWNFIIKPTYSAIREGPDNKITSKLECTPNQTKWYSVNVTGIGTTVPLERAGTVIQPPLPLPASPLETGDNIPESSPSTSGPDTGTSAESVAGPTGPSLSISVNIPSNPVTIGDDETLEATVLDSVSHLQINNAILELVVTDSAGNPIDESSDNDGDTSYALDEAADSGSTATGKYTATLRASADGYEPVSKTVSFDLVEETDDDTENFGPLSGEESDPDEDNSGNDGSLFDEDSDEDSNDNDAGELFE